MKRKKSILKYVFAAVFVIVIIIAAIAFLAKPADMVPVLTSIAPVSRGTVVSADNVDVLFAFNDMEAGIVTEDMITDKNLAVGKTISRDMEAGAPLLLDCMDDMENRKAVMANPVIAGIRASDISQFSGGIIRSGDNIDISVVDENTKKCVSVINDAYVTEVFNSDGTAITDGEGCAMIINVLIEKEAEQRLNEMLSVGTVRVCRLERSANG